MKKGSTLFLRGVVVLLGGGVLALSTLFTVAVVGGGGGLFFPILLVLYVTVLPFLFALYQTLRLLGFIDKGIAFSELSVKALKNIKYSAVAISGIYILSIPWTFTIAEKDDAPGVVLLVLVIVAASIVVAVFAAVLQKLLRNAIDIKSENDLTI